MRFSEKVVFITGGTKGLGKAMARAFLDEGARVAVNGRNTEAVATFEEEFAGKDVLAFGADITDYEGMEAAAKAVVDKWGKIDILINAAGVVNKLAPAERTKKEEFDRVIDINLKGTFYASQIMGKQMIAQGSGRLIFIASQVALFGDKGFLPYAVSKSALPLMARSLSAEWSKYGVTTCCISPGFIAGGMNEGMIKQQQFVDFLSRKTPLNRMGQVSELIATILFLASPEAQYINGENIVMDGGMTGYDQESLLDMILKKGK
jgi:NAD(P)-dependent dehydrogenase (short-subunit alcohol dehydrogenase family)